MIDVGEDGGGGSDGFGVQAWDDVLRGAEAVASRDEGQGNRHELCGEDGLWRVHLELAGCRTVVIDGVALMLGVRRVGCWWSRLPSVENGMML